MDSTSPRTIQNTLIRNLIIFLAGAVTHNIVLGDFSYASLLGNMVDASLMEGMQGYFALGNSSAIITGMLFVFAYTAVYSLVNLIAGRIKRSNELAINKQ